VWSGEINYKFGILGVNWVEAFVFGGFLGGNWWEIGKNL
jgi:hypothetical protein